jgi:hypothetical protein
VASGYPRRLLTSVTDVADCHLCVCGEQLLGMADHLTLTLGKHGFKVRYCPRPAAKSAAQCELALIWPLETYSDLRSGDHIMIVLCCTTVSSSDDGDFT